MSSSDELWGQRFMPPIVSLEVLLPNGIFLTMDTRRDNTLSVIKFEAWTKARQYVLFDLLRTPSTYVFQSVTKDATLEEFYDEQRRLCDLRLFMPWLRLVEPQGNKADRVMAYTVGLAVGLNVNDFDNVAVVDPEAAAFRRAALATCRRAVAARCANGLDAAVRYVFPPELCADAFKTTAVGPSSATATTLASKTFDVTSLLKERRFELSYSSTIRLTVWSLNDVGAKVCHVVTVKQGSTPAAVIRETIYQSLLNADGAADDVKQNVKRVEQLQRDLLLKVAGSDRFFLVEKPIVQYKYIRRCLTRNKVAQLMLMSKRHVYKSALLQTTNDGDLDGLVARTAPLDCSFIHVPTYMNVTSTVGSGSDNCDVATQKWSPTSASTSIDLNDAVGDDAAYATPISAAPMTSVASPPHRRCITLWQLETPVRIHIGTSMASVLQDGPLASESEYMLCVRVAIYHGLVPLCQARQTELVAVTSSTFNEWLTFNDLFYQDLPRGAKLCIGLCMARSAVSTSDRPTAGSSLSIKHRTASNASSISSSASTAVQNLAITRSLSQRTTSDATDNASTDQPASPPTADVDVATSMTSSTLMPPVAADVEMGSSSGGQVQLTLMNWANVPLFDWQSHLLTGGCTVALWPTSKAWISADFASGDELLNPSGQSGPNPNSETAVRLSIGFETHHVDGWRREMATVSSVTPISSSVEAASSPLRAAVASSFVAHSGSSGAKAASKMMASFSGVIADTGPIVTFPSLSDYSMLIECHESLGDTGPCGDESDELLMDAAKVEPPDGIVNNSDLISPSDSDFESHAPYTPVNAVGAAATHSAPTATVSIDVQRRLKAIARRDSIAVVTADEVNFIWRHRRYCGRFLPDILPRLLIPSAEHQPPSAVDWASRASVASIYRLLGQTGDVASNVVADGDVWPDAFGVRSALELLDIRSPDPVVRNKAVKCLELAMTDDDVVHYMLQLVQALKFEPHCHSRLADFLLTRALSNKQVGHSLFWHLRCELCHMTAAVGSRAEAASSPAATLSAMPLTVRVGMVLEAYCRSLTREGLRLVSKQVDAIDKLINLTNSLRDRQQETTKDRLHFIESQLRQSDYVDALQSIESPLDPSVILGRLQPAECRVMDSAKKPLLLVWLNTDPPAAMCDADAAKAGDNVAAVGDDLVADQIVHSILFKNGDDLRQDMLTIQLISVMDRIWQDEGLDLHMTPYTCLATGHNVGLIDVVGKAKTVYQIQKRAGKLGAIQMDSSPVYKWIREQNQTAERLADAVETFTLSCAGYCVATFILGIGDRHPDNIMVNCAGFLQLIDSAEQVDIVCPQVGEDGQIFHIDFGHFLGHFKKKFGINRERVPFVLTDDFIMVIANGRDNPRRSDEFARFQKMCGQAYLIIRRHAPLLITLLTLMLSSGVGELQSMSDVIYLRKTLALDVDGDAKALQYFQSMFSDAYGGSWTTKLDWFFHSVRH